MVKQIELQIKTSQQGLHQITHRITELIKSLNHTQDGLLNCFISHTSASLIIQENADPTAKKDIEAFFNILAPEHESWHTHTAEGPDDTTSHLKSALTNTSLNIPITKGQLALGTWQGIYLFEHRNTPHTRKLILTVLT